jgi:hypothetical protein
MKRTVTPRLNTRFFELPLSRPRSLEHQHPCLASTSESRGQTDISCENTSLPITTRGGMRDVGSGRHESYRVWGGSNWLHPRVPHARLQRLSPLHTRARGMHSFLLRRHPVFGRHMTRVCNVNPMRYCHCWSDSPLRSRRQHLRRSVCNI